MLNVLSKGLICNPTHHTLALQENNKKKKNNNKNIHLFSLCNWEPVHFAADFLWNLDMQETC